MTTELARKLPIHETGVMALAGIPKPLTQSLPQRALDEHRAKVGMICEMLSRKYDRFGWERMEPGFKQLILQDFMDALQDYPLDEIRNAARQCEADKPGKMPQEQEIRSKIIAIRQRRCDMIQPPRPVEPGPKHLGVPDQATAEAIMEAAGFTAKRFDGAQRNRMATDWAAMEAGMREMETPREAYMTASEIEAEDRRAAG